MLHKDGSPSSKAVLLWGSKITFELSILYSYCFAVSELVFNLLLFFSSDVLSVGKPAGHIYKYFESMYSEWGYKPEVRHMR